LTGLLSFMLSDEMTTGSVNTTDVDKRAYAARSHTWNIQQRKFKDAFPDYCSPNMRDLPNMGEPPRKKPAPKASPKSLPTAPIPTGQQTDPPPPQPVVPARSAADDASSATSSGSAGGWVDMFWQKWRWGLFIAIAVVVSRLSST